MKNVVSSSLKLSLNRLQKALGYEFQSQALLATALSHRSVGKDNNERLEFLGDALLSTIIAEELFNRFPEGQEGDMSRVRASLVKGETLAEIAREKNIGECLRLGEGELKTGGFRRSSILADAVEAIIGAIYLEAGLEVCRKIVLFWFADMLDSIELEESGKDSKTRLQEYMQEHKQDLPVYRVVNRLGEAHSPKFEVSCEVHSGGKKTSAISTSKRKAEKLAAKQMLLELGL